MDEIEEIQVQEESVSGMVWDKPYYYFQGKKFIPCIYDASLENALPPGEFNTVKIFLEGGMKSDLEWNRARVDALKYIEKGYMIVWEINLGLFSELTCPLSNQTQYLSLSLSIEHFRDSLWKEFGDKSLGLIIYRGSADFSSCLTLDIQQLENLKEWLQDIFVDEQNFKSETGIEVSSLQEIHPDILMKSKSGHLLLSLFCRNMAVEYMNLLTNRLPDTLPRYVILDVHSLAEDPLWQVQILNVEVFDSLNLIVDGATVPLSFIGYDKRSPYGFFGSENPALIDAIDSEETQRQDRETIGVCVPSPILCRPSHYRNLRETLQALIENGQSFRIIPESMLITNWDGLDFILFVPESLSYQGKRKLQGFCAAGGTAVTLGDLIGLPDEMRFADVNFGSSTL